jgi:hypothetical protein
MIHTEFYKNEIGPNVARVYGILIVACAAVLTIGLMYIFGGL